MGNFRTTTPSHELEYKWTGPYSASKVIINNADKLEHPYTIRKHNVFHTALLDRKAPPTTGQPPSEPQPTFVNNSNEWDVDRILDFK